MAYGVREYEHALLNAAAATTAIYWSCCSFCRMGRTLSVWLLLMHFVYHHPYIIFPTVLVVVVVVDEWK